MKTLGFTGTRDQLTSAQFGQLNEIILKLDPEIVRHGSCRGADATFHTIASNLARNIIVHPPIEQGKLFAKCEGPHVIAVMEPTTYFARNRDIVDTSEALIACPREMTEQDRGGTWYTVKYARKKGKMIFIIWPDGTVTKENNNGNLFL
jgi:hypothetical protein